MMTLLTGLLLTAVIVIALYAFGVFNTPYLDALRVAFYLLSADSCQMGQRQSPATRRTRHHLGSGK